MGDWFYDDLEVVKDVRTPTDVNIPLLVVKNETKIKPGRGRKKSTDDSNNDANNDANTADLHLSSSVATQNVVASLGDLSHGHVDRALSMQDSDCVPGEFQSGSSPSTHAACNLTDLDAEALSSVSHFSFASPGDVVGPVGDGADQAQVQGSEHQSGLEQSLVSKRKI